MFSNRTIVANCFFGALVLMCALSAQPARAQCFVTVNISCMYSMPNDCNPGANGCVGKNANDSCGTSFAWTEYSFQTVNIEFPGLGYAASDGTYFCGFYENCTCEGVAQLICTKGPQLRRDQPEWIAFGPWCDF